VFKKGYEGLVVCYLNLMEHYSDGDDYLATIYIKRVLDFDRFNSYKSKQQFERS
jgi:hypothetical protein